MNSFRLVLAGAFLVAVLCAAPLRAAGVENSNAKKLIGTWKLVKTENKMGFPVGGIVEMGKDGTLKMSAVIRDMKREIKGTYTVKGDQLTIKLTMGMETMTETMTLVKLTDTEMVTKDEKGKLDTFKKQGKE